MARKILHVDMNGFYASVECFLNPELRGNPVAVCGDPNSRHGIILAKNEEAKRYNIKTGEVIWKAKAKCPELICVPACFDHYVKFSRMARDIYERYTDRVEPFGLDECWLDISHLEDAKATADEIRETIKTELGITASVGVSFNKVFAKLGSDYKKPDATTVISEQNYKQKAWPLPAGALLFVGRAAKAKLGKRGIFTIGDIAQTKPELLQSYLGKAGLTLSTFARGEECSAVRPASQRERVKSIGNSMTSPRDLENMRDVRIVLYILAESVAASMKDKNVRGGVVKLYVRDCRLNHFSRQRAVPLTDLACEIERTAEELFCESYDFPRPVRSLGVAVSSLDWGGAEQPTLFNMRERERAKRLETAMFDVRRRFGHDAIGRCSVMCDESLRYISPKDDHVGVPGSFY